ncbi:hypothetical protein FACS189431_5630 [Alphaproteobacteria bacterium]|nr:hypothetical protein FACS189431_5630 [Alphaproteobacteria bacterium]
MEKKLVSYEDIKKMFKIDDRRFYEIKEGLKYLEGIDLDEHCVIQQDENGNDVQLYDEIAVEAVGDHE